MTAETAVTDALLEAQRIRVGLFLSALQRLDITITTLQLAARLVEIERCVERRRAS